MKNPSSFKPVTSAEFIGPARRLAQILENKAAQCLADGQPVKFLFHGSPGIGKTQLADMFAGLVSGHATQIESINGRNVTVETIRRWMEASHYLPLYGGYTVRIINELDTLNPVAQDAALTFLDEMPRQTAFIGTSNSQLSQLSERFQTRMQAFSLKAPATDDLNSFLAQWKLTAQQISQIAVGCSGNVRAALLDAQTFLDAQMMR
jgi:replication-associated recombination protein RarA